MDGILLIGAGAGIAELAAHRFDLARFGLGGEGRVGFAAGLAEEEFDGLVGVESGPLLAGGKALEDVEFAGAGGGGVFPAAPGGIVGKEVALEAGLERFVARMRPGKIVGGEGHDGAFLRRRSSMSRRQSWASPPLEVSR